MRFAIDDPELAHLLRWVQDGVVARRQLLDLGATAPDVRRMLRRRELTTAVPGVYVNHTGDLSRAQREWVAVLAAWPAALSHDSALPDPESPVVHVAVDDRRTVQAPPRCVVHRMAEFAQRVDLRAAPPRVRLEHAIIDVMSDRAASGDVASAFGSLARVGFSRQTEPRRILAALDSRVRVPERGLITSLVTDLQRGACSVLERGYLHRVERAHGLPRGTRQQRSDATGATTYQDVRYREYGLIIELDGHADHNSPRARDRDAARDLAELASGDQITVRLTYGLVYRDGCRTAGRVASILARRGWPGRPHRCPRCS